MRRRGLLGGIGAAGMAALATRSGVAAQPLSSDNSVPFFGEHQAGIGTPAQDRLVFAAFDVKATRASELRDLLRVWTDASTAMTQGQPVAGFVDSALSPPPDTGEAAGLGPANLTLTFGFGAGVFTDAFRTAARRPAALVDVPAFTGDRLQPELSGGDLGVQACADDPQVAFHAVRNLARLGRGVVQVRWMQLGFGRTATTSRRQVTPRNLMGFKDGTNNIKVEDLDVMNAHVWVGAETDQAWMRGGTYLVARRIRMRIESWDRTGLAEQELVIGRRKTSGAPLGGEREFDPVDVSARTSSGALLVASDAHVRLAAPDSNDGARILRRGYSFTDGIDPATGELDAGLFFICFQRDPRTGFVPIQGTLATIDALNEYIRHTGSAIFACPPGATPGDFVGSGLVDAA